MTNLIILIIGASTVAGWLMKFFAWMEGER